jgi:16S rRNA (guanine527-N7)-methyltransferase
MEKLKQDVQNLLGFRLSPQQCGALLRYEQELLTWNAQYNLTAIRDSEGIRTKHFLDSLSCLLVMEGKSTGRLVDIGSGAGFPGIPLKIVLPQLQLTLVDSVNKKTRFCQHVVTLLGMEKVEVIQARAEELGQDANFREKFDWATARAVAQLNTLVEYMIPLLKVGGIMIAQKGENGPAEAQNSEYAINLLGGHLRQLKQINLPGVVEERFLIMIDKVAVSPSKYPRRTGMPEKNPLRSK